MTMRYLFSILVLVTASAAAQTPGVTYLFDQPYSQFLAFDQQQLAQGRVLIDIEMRWTGAQVRYTGLWKNLGPHPLWAVAGVNANQWQTFVNTMLQKSGRWLDVEVGHFGGQKLWSGIFLEDGAGLGSEVRTDSDEAQFQVELQDAYRAGRQVIDFEAYEENGITRYAAVWVSGPRVPRTTLYYGLSSAELQDIISPQFPMDPAFNDQPLQQLYGRPLDVERYYDENAHGWRYAVVLANVPGGAWAIRFNQPATGFVAANNASTGGQRHLVDVDFWENGDGTFSYNGVWSTDVKSMHVITPLPSPVDVEPLSIPLQFLNGLFELDSGNGVPGYCGYFAKNIDTDQEIGFRETEPFYLASTSKVPMHFRLWQLDEQGAIDLDADTLFYTEPPPNSNVPQTRAHWFVDDRDSSGALGPLDVGGPAVSLRNLDSYMIQASDNAATSMLLELVLGRSDMNTWLAGQTGIGRGFDILTGITDLDRTILWQGQVEAFPAAESFYRIPTWRWEPWFRGLGDLFGDFQNYVGAGNPFPQVDQSEGHDRYFRMGLNSGEPRAFGLLLEGFEDGRFHASSATINACRNVLNASALRNQLDGFVAFPGEQPCPTPPQEFGKNGNKGSSSWGNAVADDVVIFKKEGTTIVMGFFSMYGSRSATDVRANWTPRFGYHLYSRLISDLKDGGEHELSTEDVLIGSPLTIKCDVNNTRGGDAPAGYQIRFYLSTDQVITPGVDTFLGTFTTPTVHPGDTSASVIQKVLSMPNVAEGAYYLGWILDAGQQVGEWNDLMTDNTVLYDGGGSAPRRINVRLNPGIKGAPGFTRK